MFLLRPCRAHAPLVACRVRRDMFRRGRVRAAVSLSRMRQRPMLPAVGVVLGAFQREQRDLPPGRPRARLWTAWSGSYMTGAGTGRLLGAQLSTTATAYSAEHALPVLCATVPPRAHPYALASSTERAAVVVPLACCAAVSGTRRRGWTESRRCSKRCDPSEPDLRSTRRARSTRTGVQPSHPALSGPPTELFCHPGELSPGSREQQLAPAAGLPLAVAL